MPLLLDASVWVAAAEPRQTHHAEAGALVESSVPVASLDLTFFEIANALGVKLGKPQRARLILETLLIRCGKQIVRVDSELIVAALDHASSHGLTAYDAAYVAIAQSNGWTLVSTDIQDLVSKGLAVAPDAAV
ncbi:MAG: type II toxin-antitoxin system VapC family toxin [Solirubrobacterales bacterium]